MTATAGTGIGRIDRITEGTEKRFGRKRGKNGKGRIWGGRKDGSEGAGSHACFG